MPSKPSRKSARGRVTSGQHIGFQKFKGYERAASAADVANWCGIKIEGKLVAESRAATKRVLEGLRTLDSVAASLPLRSVNDLAYRVQSEVRHMLGLDQKTDQARVRAMIVRAYVEAEQLAAAYADYLASGPKARLELDAIEKILDVLEVDSGDRNSGIVSLKSTSPVASGLSVLKRWRWAKADETKNLAASIFDGTAALIIMADQLKGLLATWEKRGRTKEIPRLFLIMRLAEAYAMSTGVQPQFHVSQKLSRTRTNTPSDWQTFITAAFDIIDFPVGVQGLDHALREVGAMRVHKAAIIRLAKWSVDPPRLGMPNLEFGELQSEGIKIDFLYPRGEG